MDILVIALQILIALGILNVWLLRPGKRTDWRGGNAQTLKDEFAVYGLPPWFMEVIRFLKITFALLLIVGIWVPVVIRPAALGLAVLMLGAIAMHMKVKDPVKKSLPALSLLMLCVAVASL